MTEELANRFDIWWTAEGSELPHTRETCYTAWVNGAYAALEQVDRASCEWTIDDTAYKSSCGMSFEFTDDRENLTDHDFTYCPKCGSAIIHRR